MMGKGHIAAALPAAVSYGWTMAEHLGLIGGVACFGSVMLVCKSPDLDHPRFSGRMHFGAFLVRSSARAAYCIRTSKDRRRLDVHRGPSHSLEAALLVGLLTVLVLSASPHTRPWAWWIGLGVTTGWFDHVLVDALTPSGVPMCATWNYFRYGEVWRRHAFSWRWRGPLPTITLMPVDESHPGCRPGLFYTDSGAEHLLVVPGFYAFTAVVVLVRAGIGTVVLAALTGLPV